LKNRRFLAWMHQGRLASAVGFHHCSWATIHPRG